MTNFPLAVLRSCHNLKVLKIRLLSFEDEAAHPDSPERLSHLDSLSVRLTPKHFPHFVDWLLKAECPLSVTHLYKLAIFTRFPIDHATSRLLQATCCLLRDFDFGIHPMRMSVLFPPTDQRVSLIYVASTGTALSPGSHDEYFIDGLKSIDNILMRSQFRVWLG